MTETEIKLRSLQSQIKIAEQQYRKELIKLENRIEVLEKFIGINDPEPKHPNLATLIRWLYTDLSSDQ